MLETLNTFRYVYLENSEREHPRDTPIIYREIDNQQETLIVYPNARVGSSETTRETSTESLNKALTQDMDDDIVQLFSSFSSFTFPTH